MNPQEFTALRVTVLVRSDKGRAVDIKNHFNSIPFQYQMQDALGDLIKANLKEAEVDFAEVIISLDAPAETAKKVEQPKKASLLGRLFGGG
jgi:hypothetical protein